MEVTLIVVTLISIALAIAMGILTWRLLQEERLRSDARVAALEQGLAETLQDAYVTQSAASAASPRVAKAPVGDDTTSPAAASTGALIANGAAPSLTPRADLFTRDDTDWLAHFPASTVKPATASHGATDKRVDTRAFAMRAASEADAVIAVNAANASHDMHGMHAAYEANDDPLGDAPMSHPPISDAPVNGVPAETAVNAGGGLFGQVESDDTRVGFSRHVFAVAAVAAVMIGAVLAFWTIGRLMEPAADRPGTNVARAGAPAAAAALELMSLQQAMQDGTLTISGLVRNPRGGVQQDRLTAVVFFFDGQGGFLSSTRAPLDYRALAPGEESPFQLSAPAPPGVARYRVSFRRDEGAVVPHVDRRQQVQQSLQARPNQHSRLGQPGESGPGESGLSGQFGQPGELGQHAQLAQHGQLRQQEARRS